MTQSILPSPSKVQALVQQLRDRLQGFTVCDRQGLEIGELYDLGWNPKKHLILTVVLPHAPRKIWRLHNVRIHRLEPAKRSLLIDVELIDLYQAIRPPVSSPVVPPMSDVVQPDAANPSPASAASLPQSIPAPRPLDRALEFSVLEQSHPSSANLNSANLSAADLNQTEATVHLLSERVVVNTQRRKVGDVVIRKQIETRMVQVPVRHETLIVEQVSPEYHQLAAIDLGALETPVVTNPELLTGQETPSVRSDRSMRVSEGLRVAGQFTSIAEAQEFLTQMAQIPNPKFAQIRLELMLEDAEHQGLYQQLLKPPTPAPMPPNPT